MAEISINGFSGMNNVTSNFYADKNVVSPRLVLNADVDQAGNITKRAGLTLYLSLSGSHSLWACDTCMLCAAGGKLYRIDSGVAVELADISGPVTESLSYELCENQVYISNSFWKGVLNPLSNQISNWGIAIPPGPMLITSTGNLPAGTYFLIFTNVDGSQISGNGPISEFTLTEEGGISVLNRPDGALVWMTDQNDYIFSLVGATDNVVNLVGIEPLPSFMCSPPGNMTCLTYAFGRMWGAIGDEVFYSEPHQPGWFKLASNRFKFNSNVTMIAKVPSGLFFGMESQTVFLHGTEPDQMVQSNAGAGSIKGTLAYCNNVPYLADVLGTQEKVFSDVPIWRTTDGIVAGNTTGRLFNLTKNKIKTGTIDRGASLYRTVNGVFQFLTSSVIASGSPDAKVLAALTAGQIPVSNITNKIPTSTVGLSEEVTTELWRNGVLITE